VSARIIAKAGQSDNKKSQLWDLSIKPKMLEGRMISGIFFLKRVSFEPATGLH
jgi:hypothetical protein